MLLLLLALWPAGLGPLLADPSAAVDIDEDCDADADVDDDDDDVTSDEPLVPPWPPAPSSGSATTLPPHAAARENVATTRGVQRFIPSG